MPTYCITSPNNGANGTLSWTLAQQTPEMLSAVNSMLSKKLQPLVLHTPAKTPIEPYGNSGGTFVQHSSVTQLWKSLMTPSPTYKSLRTDTAPVQWLPAGLMSALEQWKVPFMPWVRCLPHWAAQALASLQMENSALDSHNNYQPTKNRTRPHLASNLCPSQS